MQQQALLLTLDTIRSKKTDRLFDICVVYQSGKISTVIIPNPNEEQFGQTLDFVKQGGKPCELTIKIQGTRISYTDIKIQIDK
jgi:hypothetical protein